MSNKLRSVLNGNSLEDLKQINAFGAEYWSARDLQPFLGYSQWRRFEQAITRALASCEQSGNNPSYHFAGAGKMVALGSDSIREIPDFHLSRFACYLIAQNGDSRKPEIAQAQEYFAIQTRRQELSDQLAADLERLELRKQTATEFKALSGAAQQAGVQNKMFGAFHDAGYKGLYGGLRSADIKTKKGISAKENLMDRMNTTELAANQFRMTQARDKLSREHIHNQQQAIHAHEQVGKEVREAIKRIGGDLPERIAPVEHIKIVEKRIKTSIPKLELDHQDAHGLLGDPNKPLIITEGVADMLVMKNIFETLEITDLDGVSLQTMSDCKELYTLLLNLSQVSQNRKIIGIFFDQDNPDIINKIGDKKDFGNNVSAFYFPTPRS